MGKDVTLRLEDIHLDSSDVFLLFSEFVIDISAEDVKGCSWRSLVSKNEHFCALRHRPFLMVSFHVHFLQKVQMGGWRSETSTTIRRSKMQGIEKGALRLSGDRFQTNGPSSGLVHNFITAQIQISCWKVEENQQKLWFYHILIEIIVGGVKKV